MTISEWLNSVSKKVDRLDAELILLNLLHEDDRSYLVAHDDEQLSSNLIALADAQCDRRASGEPLAYILGWREFYGRNFKVTRNVLVPRPETEDIIDIAKTLKPKQIVDVGTGSGCIAITCALELPKAKIVAIDISTPALAIAQTNAKQLGARVEFHKSNLLSDFQPDKHALIIANLPYVDRSWDWLDSGSLGFEPELALYAEEGGLALIYELIKSIDFSCDLLIEADPSQHKNIIDYAKSYGFTKKKQKNFIIHLKK